MSLPDHINAIKVITYNVGEIVDSLKEMNDDDNYEPTLAEVIEYIDDWLYDDFGDTSGITLQDENGNEL